MSTVDPADITWDGNTPISGQHGDVYFSKDSGLEESEYVFIKHNHLPSRWEGSAALSPFVIVETGFGTGLNFLATWRTWLASKAPKRPLHFISIEKYPLTKETLKTCHRYWPEVSELGSQLTLQYPPLVKGHHLLCFEQGRIKLSLIFGDIKEELPKQSFLADCWFLDGFAPSKNPDMWSDELFSLMESRSRSEATVATFTSAGLVKRGLRGAGFDIKKVAGFGRKREMITGRYTKEQHTRDATQRPRWHISDYPLSGKQTLQEKRALDSSPNFREAGERPHYDAAVVGAGLAGITTARSLAEAGLRVVLIESHDQVVAGASGQSQLAQYAKLPTAESKEFRFILHSLLFSQRYFNHYQQRNQTDRFWHPTGLLQLAWSEKEELRLEKLIKNNTLPDEIISYVDANRASDLAGFKIRSSGLWFQKCGWLDPKIFAEQIVQHPNITIISNTCIQSLEYVAQDKLWKLHSNDKFLSATHVVLCNSNHAREFTQTAHIKTKPLRGQITTILSQTLAKTHCILCGEGYLCPPVSDKHHFGATYDLSNKTSSIIEQDNDKNISSIKDWLPGWIPDDFNIKSQEISASAGLRCTTPDYMPFVGPAPDESGFHENFSQLRHDAKAHQTQSGVYLDNLYLNVGHGSKGLVTTPLSAQYICALITDAPNPINHEMQRSLSPARMIIKELIQRKR